MNKNHDVFDRLFADRRRKDRKLECLSMLKVQSEKREAELRGETTMKILQKSRVPDCEILTQAGERREKRLHESMLELYAYHSRKLAKKREDKYLPVSLRLYRAKGKGQTQIDDMEAFMDDPLAHAIENKEKLESFLSRQKIYASVKESKRNILKKWASEECPFEPRIDPNSDRLVGCGNRSRKPLYETPKKLSENKPVKSNIPTINPYSDVLATACRDGKRSVYERLYPKDNITVSTSSSTPSDTSPNHRDCKAQMYSFMSDESPNDTEVCIQKGPVINKNVYKHIRSVYNLSSPDSVTYANEQTRLRKERLIKEHQDEMLANEMSECTFHPKIGGKRPSAFSKPAHVSGMDEFLNNQRMAMEMQQERKKLDESFISLRSGNCGARRDLPEVTIPKPFMLRTEMRKSNL